MRYILIINVGFFSFIYSITGYGANDSARSTDFVSSTSNIQNQNLDDTVSLDEELKNDKSINVTQQISDEPIQKRIQNILTTSDWFVNIQVISNEGIVVLSGSTHKQEYKNWAGSVATRTEGVVAVINKIVVATNDENSLSPVLQESQLLWRKLEKALPSIGISFVVLIIFYIIAKYVAALSLRLIDKKIPSVMLKRLIANAVAIPVMLIGIYLILRITGLSKIATTIIGGTGLLSLVLGFAFRDIAENFLASILISIQRPFRLGETIKVLDYVGVVQAVTTRGTIIMTLDGNHVQIPNTTIYKEAIVNFSANPNLRLDFVVGIGYDTSISDAQTIALQVLVDHPAVLESPEPWVLAEALTASTVNLRIYFWVNSKIHNPLKVKSAVIRNVKYAFLHKNISMPDDAREVIFPQGVRVFTDPVSDSLSAVINAEPNIVDNKTHTEAGNNPHPEKAGDNKASTEAEANLATDIPAINSQASQYSLDQGDSNLLTNKNNN